jgi:hypothetical protein
VTWSLGILRTGARGPRNRWYRVCREHGLSFITLGRLGTWICGGSIDFAPLFRIDREARLSEAGDALLRAFFSAHPGRSAMYAGAPAPSTSSSERAARPTRWRACSSRPPAPRPGRSMGRTARRTRRVGWCRSQCPRPHCASSSTRSTRWGGRGGVGCWAGAGDGVAAGHRHRAAPDARAGVSGARRGGLADPNHRRGARTAPAEGRVTHARPSKETRNG